jgi:DNA-directed RNA polymerase subunit F
MIGKQVVTEKPVPLVSVRKILEKRKEDGELTYEQKLVLEYVSEFAKTGIRKTEEAVEKLKELGIDEKKAVKIIDVLPKTKEEVKLIFEKNPPSEEQIKKILDIAAGI